MQRALDNVILSGRKAFLLLTQSSRSLSVRLRHQEPFQSVTLSHVLLVLVVGVLYLFGLSLSAILSDPYGKVLKQIAEIHKTCNKQYKSEALLKADAGIEGHIVRYKGYRSPRNPCGHSDAAVHKFLEVQGINCTRGGKRVWAEGENHYYKWLKTRRFRKLMKRSPEEGEDPIVCAVYCVDHEPPCLNDKCLIPVHLRRNSTDPVVAKQLLENGEYDLVQPEMHFTTILDAGANCGIATIIFATMFPDATIVSVEPASNNYNMLRLNTRFYPNVIPVHAGLWPRVAELSLINGQRTKNQNEWGFMVYESKKVPTGAQVLDTLQAVSVDFLLEVFGLYGFDLLKIDIEGSEKELLEKSPGNQLNWLSTAKMAMFEVHDDMRIGSHGAVADAFFERKDWYWVMQYGEYHVYKRKGWHYGS